MNHHDSSRTLRTRGAEFDKELDRLSPDMPSGSSPFVAVTYSQGAYPTAIGKVHACHPAEIGCVEAEDESGTVSADTTATIYAQHVGNAVPPLGSQVIIRGQDGRYYFRWDAA